MPRIFGHSLLFIILAAVIMYAIGFAWYGFIFPMAEMEETAPWRMWGVGIGIPVVVAFGLANIISRTSAAGPGGYVTVALVCGVAFALTTLGYALAYEAAFTINDFLRDAAHLLVVFAVGGAVLSFGAAKA